jgi:hypothetical protein
VKRNGEDGAYADCVTPGGALSGGTLRRRNSSHVPSPNPNPGPADSKNTDHEEHQCLFRGPGDRTRPGPAVRRPGRTPVQGLQAAQHLRQPHGPAARQADQGLGLGEARIQSHGDAWQGIRRGHHRRRRPGRCVRLRRGLQRAREMGSQLPGARSQHRTDHPRRCQWRGNHQSRQRACRRCLGDVRPKQHGLSDQQNRRQGSASAGEHAHAAILFHPGQRAGTLQDDIRPESIDTVSGSWDVSSPETAKGSFSAIGYVFGVDVQRACKSRSE